MHELLSLLNTYQIIVIMPLFTVSVPANAGGFLAEIIKIAAFEVVDTKPYLDRILELEPREPINSNFETVGLESVYFLHNLGTLFLAYVFYVILIAFAWLLRRKWCS